MSNKLSRRLREIVDALPLFEGARVLEIGCGSGAAAREIVKRIGKGYVLGIDRSLTSVRQAISGSAEGISSGTLFFRHVAAEQFLLDPEEEKFDLALAVRVGALDGRHPELEEPVLKRLAAALKPEGKVYIDGGDPLREVPLDKYRQPSGSETSTPIPEEVLKSLGAPGSQVFNNNSRSLTK